MPLKSDKLYLFSVYLPQFTIELVNPLSISIILLESPGSCSCKVSLYIIKVVTYLRDLTKSMPEIGEFL